MVILSQIVNSLFQTCDQINLLYDMIDVVQNFVPIRDDHILATVPDLVKEAGENTMHFPVVDDMQTVGQLIAVQAEIRNTIREEDVLIGVVLEIREQPSVNQFYREVAVVVDQIPKIADILQPLSRGEMNLHVEEIQYTINGEF